ncbi:N-acylneuraminate cytidylyltransferase/CMP-N,N'-diacetyllegionaminic acid synthase [Hydrogenispora ethanolica]|uniref:N-acylneuraminate cytidylyltransferase/CMP-N,N'-diacetyllegionaminic acid synthase n=1 Tax=Hydrogenispora ethanolica TaxID=1082276 RepID=A0A4R1RTT4_HYDET|nr:acylneuraminate cytidylyltransferase family protein [Hydrogenispora ethanolica]TCL69965.1 N-acylneuraminate cytidylyltransferase/CMP-N,N'-diacetyllegionaminic acid synthase [Hydrogenispora ethanolica]
MNSSTTLLAIIPARSGSKRIPGKNIRLLAGKPLIVYSIECALRSPSVARVIVSTDSPEIRELSQKAGADAPFLRPKELAGDETPTVEVVRHTLNYLQAAEGIHYDYFVLLQPTSPLRTAIDLETAFQLLRTASADSVVSVNRNPIFSSHLVTEENGFINPARGFYSHEAALFRLNGAIYISRTQTVLESGQLLGEKIISYRMPDLRSVDIDTEDDLRLAELLLGVL